MQKREKVLIAIGVTIIIIVLILLIYRQIRITGLIVYDINTCGDDPVNANSVYRLNNDLPSSTGTCLEFGANNIVLDCEGHSITYATDGTGNGIEVKGASAFNKKTKITIKNCKIKEGATSGNTHSGILLEYANNITISNNTIETTRSRGYGVLSGLFSTRINITGNNITTSGGGAGIKLLDADFSTVFRNIININAGGDTDSSGIVIEKSQATYPNDNILKENNITVSAPGVEGIRLQDDSRTIIENNVIRTSQNNARGIYMKGSLTDFVFNNTIATAGNNAYGIYMDGGGVQDQYGSIISSTNIFTKGTDAFPIRIENKVLNVLIEESILNASDSGTAIISIAGDNTLSTYEWNFTNARKDDGTLLDSDIRWGTNALGRVNVHWRPNIFIHEINNKPIKNAELNATHQSTGQKQTRYTDSQGFTNITHLDFSANRTFVDNPPSIWLFNASKFGFESNTTTKTLSAYFLIDITLKRLSSVSLSSCMVLDIPDMLYNLSADVNGESCFTITNNNITLDCKGYTITYASIFSGVGIDTIGANYTKIKNCNLNETENKFYSIAINLYSGHNNSIINNTITAGGFASSSLGALNLDSTLQNNITKNKITLKDAGVFKNAIYSYQSKNNYVGENEIVFDNSLNTGIYLDFGSDENIIRQNKITNLFPKSVTAIWLSNSEFNSIKNNTITLRGNNTAIGLQNSNSNNIQDGLIDLIGGVGQGIRFVQSSNANNFSRITIANDINNDAVFIQSGSHNFTFFNSLIFLSSRSINVTPIITYGEWNFTNVTGISPDNVGGNGVLNIHWPLEVFVKNETNNVPIEDATVNMSSSQLIDFQVLSTDSILTTDSTGRIKTTILTWVVFYGVQTNFTEYNINAKAIGFFPNETKVVVVAPKFVELSLKPFQQAPAPICGSLNESNRIYTLASSTSVNDTCFTINADNVVLDGKGFEIMHSASTPGYGILVNNSNGFAVINLNIKDNATGGTGIFLNNSDNFAVKDINISSMSNNIMTILVNANNGEIDSVIINITGDNSTGIYSVTNNTNIRNSRIFSNGINSNGIFSNGEDNSIVDSIINISGSALNGISLWTGDGNKIRRNFIVTYSGNSINVYNSSNSNIDSNNIITNIGNGIKTFSSINLSIVNNNLGMYGTASAGILLDKSNNANIDNNNIFGDSNNGADIVIAETSNSVFRNNRINASNNVAGLIFSGLSDNNLFIDSSINSLVNDSMFTDSAGTISFINVTFADNRIFFDALSLSRLNVHWYFDVHVRNETLVPINGANIELRDSGNNVVFSDASDNSGNIARKTVMDYSRNAAGTTNKNPHTITATKSGYDTLSQQITINTNIKSILTMLIPPPQQPSPPVNETPEDGDGGTTGGAAGAQTYRVSEIQLERGITLNLKKGDKINMSLGGKYYIIKYDSFSGNIASFTINEQKSSFIVGDEKRFDLNRDGKDDLIISLDELKNGVATLYLKKIVAETIPPEKREVVEECNANNCDGECVNDVCVLEEEKAPQRTFLYVSISLIILILIVAAIIIYIVIKRRKDVKRIKPSGFPSIKPKPFPLKPLSKIPPKMPPKAFPARRPLPPIGKSFVPVAKPQIKPADKEAEETLKKLKEIGEERSEKKETLDKEKKVKKEDEEEF
ncbi:right-handed parallel beta-helix repeat-containing protein [Candidatus Pacearchaeota archaeon]|nr:right-handed parallel beta-helix repeat-containing protein [Candidatus Pacearchaeota archaeon]